MYDRILARLDAKPARWKPHTWLARCPVHGDEHPSLELRIGPRGQLLAYCFGCKCGWRALVVATGTVPDDWFADPLRETPVHPQGIVATYDYRSEAGVLLYQCVRIEPGYRGEKKTFCQRRPNPEGGWFYNLDGVERVLYNLPALVASPPTEPVVVVEGEKCVECLRKLGILATTNVGGAGRWLHDYGRHLAGRDVTILPDHDDAGLVHATQVAGCLAYWWPKRFRIASLPHLPPKGDVVDWYLRQEHGLSVEALHEQFWRLVGQSPSWSLSQGVI